MSEDSNDYIRYQSEFQKTPNAFKAGDVVEILRRVELDGEKGWHYWSSFMNRTVGKTGKIREVDQLGFVVEIDCDDDSRDTWTYPFLCTSKDRQPMTEEKFKKHDNVEVTSISKWRYWKEEMSDTIGMVGVVTDIQYSETLDGMCGLVRIPNKNPNWYPLTCLTKIGNL